MTASTISKRCGICGKLKRDCQCPDPFERLSNIAKHFGDLAAFLTKADDAARKTRAGLPAKYPKYPKEK